MFRVFEELRESLNMEQICSYTDLEKYNEEGLLDKKLEELDLKDFKEEVRDYLFFLFIEDGTPHYKKQLELHKRYNIKIDCISEYMLCLYFGDINAYRNISLFFKHIAEKFRIEPFNQISESIYTEKMREYYNIKDSFNTKYNRILHEVYLPYSMNEHLYENYEKNGYSEETSFVWAEEITYLERLNSDKTNVEFVARDYGDGFGYDILATNPVTGKEQLIEVKSGKREAFTLTEHEYSVMHDASQNNAEYLVYKYYLTPDNKYYRYILKYIPERNSFIDTLTSEEYLIEELIQEDSQNIYEVKRKQKVLTR